MYGHAGGGDSSAEPQAVEPAWYETGNNVTTTQLLGSKRWQSASVWSYDGLLTRLTMMRENGMPPMQLMPASRLEGLGEIPRSDQNHAVDAIEAVKSCGRDAENKPKAVLVMFSHRWLRPRWPDPNKRAHPDSREAVKAHAAVQWAKWFKWWRVYGSGREFVKGITTDPDLQIFFWIDFVCVDQDNPGPQMAALPAYVSACAEVLIFATSDYDERAWCQVELMMAYAFMTVGDKIFQVGPGFEHRRQAAVAYQRYTVPDPLQGKLTCEDDRKVIGELRATAVDSRAFTFGKACRGLFCTDMAAGLLWTCCCCGWLGLAPYLNSRRLRPGRSAVYRLTPTGSTTDRNALIALTASMRGLAADYTDSDDEEGATSTLLGGAGGKGAATQAWSGPAKQKAPSSAAQQKPSAGCVAAATTSGSAASASGSALSA